MICSLIFPYLLSVGYIVCDPEKSQPVLSASIRAVSQKGWHFLSEFFFFFLQRRTACELEAYHIALSNVHQLNMQFGTFMVKVIMFYQFCLVSAPL